MTRRGRKRESGCERELPKRRTGVRPSDSLGPRAAPRACWSWSWSWNWQSYAESIIQIHGTTASTQPGGYVSAAQAWQTSTTGIAGAAGERGRKEKRRARDEQ